MSDKEDRAAAEPVTSSIVRVGGEDDIIVALEALVSVLEKAYHPEAPRPAALQVARAAVARLVTAKAEPAPLAKPLEWSEERTEAKTKWQWVQVSVKAATAIGVYEISWWAERREYDPEDAYVVFLEHGGVEQRIGSGATLDEAQAVAQRHFEGRGRANLVGEAGAGPLEPTRVVGPYVYVLQAYKSDEEAYPLAASLDETSLRRLIDARRDLLANDKFHLDPRRAHPDDCPAEEVDRVERAAEAEVAERRKAAAATHFPGIDAHWVFNGDTWDVTPVPLVTVDP